VGHQPRVVIVGAGFGGLECAKALAGKDVDVTIVDRHNHHTFQPLLYQVATAGLGADDVAHSVRGVFQRQANVSFRLGTVIGVDPDARAVALDEGPALPYDHLVLAAGAATADFGVPGVAEHAFGLKSLPEALALRNHLLACVERADREPPARDDGILTVVIVGGGPTGVELSGALRELVDLVLRRDYHDLDLSAFRVVLVEATDHVLGAFHPRSQGYALERLLHMGIEVRLSASVARIEADGVVLADGERIPSRTVVWVGGVRAVPLADALPFERGRSGRIVVDESLRVPGHPEVRVIGDLALANDAKGRLLPGVAAVAMQGGRFAAADIVRSIVGEHAAVFRYRDKGSMATIGRNAAVTELPPGIRIRGFLAWVAWLFLHLMYLVGFRNRLNVLVNWAWNYVTYDRGARLIVRPDRSDG
jgi:NADH:ubiquinone reductase (H+-translocating)